MELVEEKALKTSFLPEMTSKSSQQAFCEDLWTGNGANSVSGDDFFVDGLLDFSNDDVEEEEEEESEEEKGFFSVSSQCQNSNFSVKDDFASLPESELSVPADDLENLEWLSHFVDDSFLDFSLQYLEGPQPEKTQTPKQSRSEPDMVSTPMIRTTGFLNSVPSKARSKRSRTGGRVWSLGSLSFTESSSSSSSSSSSISSPSSRFNFSTRQNLELLNHFGKPAKKQKKKPVLETGSTQPQRRCSHCGVQKTPQWRTGPLGAKTLCNACGVRYKSGRLLPEYRPACSPTFLSEVHSNNHRKVLEMRRKKETVQLEYGLEPVVQSF